MLKEREFTSKKLFWLIVVLVLLLIATAVIASKPKTKTNTDPNVPLQELTWKPKELDPFPVGTTQCTTCVVKTQQSEPVWVTGAKEFIYQHESGNRPTAKNPIGCYGLGQDCNGVVENLCGADYACQDDFFTKYMLRRYGSWENAVTFWKEHSWW